MKPVVTKKAKKQKLRFPLNLSVSSIFIFITALLFGSITWVTYQESSTAAAKTADKIFIEVTGKVSERINLLFNSASILTSLTETNLSFLENPQGNALTHPGVPYLIKILETNPHFYTVYVGYENSDFLQVIATRNNSIILEKHQAPTGTDLILRSITRNQAGQRLQYWNFLQADGTVLSSRIDQQVDYDPTKRPWYRSSLNQKGPFFTAPYIFNSLKKPGITVAHKTNAGLGVFGIDITLSSLSDFLSKQQLSTNSSLFLFNTKGQIIVHQQENALKLLLNQAAPSEVAELSFPKAEQVADPSYGRIVKSYLAAGAPQDWTSILSFENQPAVVRVSNVGEAFGKKMFLVVTAPISDFTEHLDKMQYRSLQFSLLALILAIPLIVLVSRRISRAMSHLVIETQKIRNFDLDGDGTVDSKIIEVYRLSEAFTTMKKALRTFSGATACGLDLAGSDP